MNTIYDRNVPNAYPNRHSKLLVQVFELDSYCFPYMDPIQIKSAFN